MKLPSRIPAPNLNFNISLGRRSGADVVGLDIQPGFVAAVRAKVNGSIVAEHAVSLPLPPDTMREGEVLDEVALGETLRELFATGGLGKRVRVGVANQRTVLRTLELPPVTDQKELAAAVTFQAQDQVPMPLNNAVLDFHPLGVLDTPAGPRQRVVLVAAQRDMIERLLSAVQSAGLTPEGIDLSAFAMIRSLYRPEGDAIGRVLYLNVDGLTNLAIAEGTACRFTRVVGGGLEGMASELAERRAIALVDARALLAGADLLAEPEPEPEPSPAPAEQPADSEDPFASQAGTDTSAPPASREEAYAAEMAMSYEEQAKGTEAPVEPAPTQPGPDGDVRAVLESGIREISGEVRNSLDFHRSQDGGGEVSHVVLSGAAQDIPGFAEALHSSLGVEVRPAELGASAGALPAGLSAHRLAIAIGLAAIEAPQ